MIEWRKLGTYFLYYKVIVKLIIDWQLWVFVKTIDFVSKF